jgi:lysophospholipase L1-like esterase
VTARRVLTAAAVAVFTAAPFALSAVPAGAKSRHPQHASAKHSSHHWGRTEAVQAVTPGSDYLALGDSVTFGYEESSVVPAPNYLDAASLIGYPAMLGSELHLNVANASCPGETSASLVDANAISNGCENTLGQPTGYRTAFPLHVNYTGSQLAFAVSYLRSHPRTRLVSLMIGANDAFVCDETTADQCTSPSELQALLTSIEKNVTTTLSTIRHQAHYRGQIVIVNYYSLDNASAADNAQTAFLNTAMDTAAKPFGVEIADGFGEWQAASVHSAGDPCTAGLLTQLSGGGCGIHPSFAGQALLAQSVEDAIAVG